MAAVLHVYKEVEILNEGLLRGEIRERGGHGVLRREIRDRVPGSVPRTCDRPVDRKCTLRLLQNCDN
jgi:hypothetical protein